MSTETTNKKIKIDNGTTFGKTYTDKAIDEKETALNGVIPTDIGIKDNKLGLLHDTKWLTNQGAINLDGFTYDESTNTLKSSGGGSSIPVVEGTITESTDVSQTVSIPSVQTKAFILHIEEYSTYIYINVFQEQYITSFLFDEESEVFIYGSDTKLMIKIISTSNIITITGTYASNTGNIFNYTIPFVMKNPFILKHEDAYAFISVIANRYYGITFYDENTIFLYSGSGTNIQYEIITLYKPISLFGNHSILVPSDSSDTNIDLYHHNMVMKNASGSMQLFLSYTSSSNLVVDSFTDLNTLLGTTKRFIPCSGYSSPTSEGCPCIQAIDWQGAYASSKFITNTSASGGLSNFTVITDDVTTL